MIEVERPFIVSDAIKAALLKKAEFIKSVKNSDIYYDTEDWSLFRSNVYFRKRNGRFELKRPVEGFMQNVSGVKTRIFDEIDDEEQIKEILKINENGALSETIPNA